MKKKYLVGPHVLWVILFTLIPLMLIFIYGVTVPTDEGVRFSFEYFRKAFQPIYRDVYVRSLVLALICTIICLIVGYPLALILSNNENKNNIIIFLFILPMWMNFLLRTYAWLSLLEKNGLINNLLRILHLPTINILYTNTAIVIGMVYNFLPFMVLPIYTVLNKIDKSLIEAAQDLGANKFKAFIKIIFPLSLPGVFSGISMVFMPAVTTFVIPRLLGGGKVNLIGNIIEEQFIRNDNWNFGSTLSIILMIIVLISMKIIGNNEKQQKSGGLK